MGGGGGVEGEKGGRERKWGTIRLCHLKQNFVAQRISFYKQRQATKLKANAPNLVQAMGQTLDVILKQLKTIPQEFSGNLSSGMVNKSPNSVSICISESNIQATSSDISSGWCTTKHSSCLWALTGQIIQLTTNLRRVSVYIVNASKRTTKVILRNN